jgi:hypothetical protein
MEKIIYLVRHGIVKDYPNHDHLEDKGIQFSKKLPILINEKKIDFIAYVKDKNRCFDTIKNLLKINIKVELYTKSDFNMLIPMPLIEALKYNTSIICYGKSEKNTLLNFFKISPKDEDYTYEVIYKINFLNNDIEEIPTGFSKTN